MHTYLVYIWHCLGHCVTAYTAGQTLFTAGRTQVGVIAYVQSAQLHFPVGVCEVSERRDRVDRAPDRLLCPVYILENKKTVSGNYITELSSAVDHGQDQRVN